MKYVPYVLHNVLRYMTKYPVRSNLAKCTVRYGKEYCETAAENKQSFYIEQYIQTDTVVPSCNQEI